MNTGDTHIFRPSKELREWGTFILSLLTLIAIPIAAVILHSQRLELMKEVSDKYVPKEVYAEDQLRVDRDRQETRQQIGVIQGKLDSVLLEQVHLNDNITLVKEQFALIKK